MSSISIATKPVRQKYVTKKHAIKVLSTFSSENGRYTWMPCLGAAAERWCMVLGFEPKGSASSSHCDSTPFGLQRLAGLTVTAFIGPVYIMAALG
jgi:hypothetical protein